MGQGSLRVGLIGLGAMGFAMAGRLAGTGEPALGFDLDPGRAGSAAVEAAADAAALCAAADLVLLSLPSEAAVAAIGEIFVAAARPGAILVDCSTVGPDASRALAGRVAAAGRRMLDAPVSGGPAGAAAGTLAMMVGGEAATLAAARPVLERLAQRIVHVGGAGAGCVAKLVNNAMVATHLLVAAEALRMARLEGVDPASVLAAVNGASGRSGASEVNFLRWILSGSFDSGFSTGLMRKDLSLAARLAGADTPLLAAAFAAWRESRVADAQDFNRVAAEREALA
ncbi:MAG: NAD(P)-dependent oxidoreductase [Acetobacteraceae bacterium]|nr:NAD(P)-dependent oxidoreductase [Acetobacteraceae bacterium]